MPKFLALVALMLCGMASAAEPDALDKCKSVRDLEDYYQLIESEATRQVGSRPEISISVIPAFGEEHVVVLADNKVHVVWMKNNVWYQGARTDANNHFYTDFSNVKPQSTHTVGIISTSTYQKLVSTFSFYISSSVAREVEGNDGVSFYFRDSTGNCATTWMPNDESTAGRLVAIMRLLRETPDLRGRQAKSRNEAQINVLLNQVQR